MPVTTIRRPVSRIAQFPGTCAYCNRAFVVGSDEIVRGNNGWQHNICPAKHCLICDRSINTGDADICAVCVHEATEAAQFVAVPAQYRSTSQVVATTTIRSGYYTVVDAGEHRTYRIREPRERSRRDGRLYVSVLTGSSNTSDYTYIGMLRNNRFAWGRDTERFQGTLTAICLATLLTDSANGQHEANMRYALTSTNCYRCGLLLTTPESIESGIGPICAGRE